MLTLVQESGGAGSAYALKLALENETDVVAMFADVKGTGYSHFWSDLPEIDNLLHERFGGESADTYRFLWQLSHALNTPIERIEDGRSIWSIFGETRAFRLFVNNRFICKASDILKRETCANWIEKHYTPGEYQIALGMDVLEKGRIEKASYWWQKRLGWPVRVYSPLIQEYERSRKIIDNCVISDWLYSIGVDAPKAYEEGFPHNNCGQTCVQAGQTQWAMLYRLRRNVYMYAAWMEDRLRRMLGIDATILKIERDGVTRPITLLEFIPLIEAGEVNEKDMGQVCGCFAFAPMTKFLAEAPLVLSSR